MPTDLVPVITSRRLARIPPSRDIRGPLTIPKGHRMAPSLTTKVTGIEFENPFLLASGPPGTNAKVIAKSFDLGWGGVVCKTISLDASKVINTAPRYGKLKARESQDVVVGFENIELISDRPFDTWLD